MKLAYSEKTNMVVWTDYTPEEWARLQQVPEGIKLPIGWAAPCAVTPQAIAANLGLPAFSPILTNYDWPRAPWIKAPFAHQKEMSAFLTLHHRAHNLAEIGTGKTLGCLWAADFLQRHGHLGAVLVLCPLSTVNSVWRNHIAEHFAGRRTAVVAAESKAKRLKALGDTKANFIIMNNEGLTLDHVQTAIGHRDDIRLIIVDESDRYRNRNTDRYAALESVLGDRALWLNTGTPTPKLPTDAWAQQNLVAKPKVSYRQFEDRTTYKITPFKRIATSVAKDEVVKLLQPAIRFLRKDCIDLPPTQVIDQQCDMTDEQLKALRKLKKDMRIELGGKQINTINEATLRNKILQVMAGAVYDAEHEVHVIDSKPRIARVRDLCDSSDGKTLVFTHLTSIAKMLHADLGGALIIGGTSLGQRTQIFKDFQEKPKGEGHDIIVADARCMSHGLTLVAADKVIWYTPADSSGTYVQANGRITRPGQERETLIYQLWVSMLERQVYLRHMGAESLQGLVMSWLEEFD